MDCVRTAIRQGATSVTCLYRRDRENMPGSQRETVNAEEEGVQFEWLAAPRALAGEAGGVTAVRAARMRLGPPDASGRRAPEEVEGGDFERPATLVIKALGFEPEDLPALFAADDLKGGAVEHGPRFFSQPTCHHAPDVYGGLRAQEACDLLRRFFSQRR